jgi:hypothetical protein
VAAVSLMCGHWQCRPAHIAAGRHTPRARAGRRVGVWLGTSHPHALALVLPVPQPPFKFPSAGHRAAAASEPAPHRHRYCCVPVAGTAGTGVLQTAPCTVTTATGTGVDSQCGGLRRRVLRFGSFDASDDGRVTVIELNHDGMTSSAMAIQGYCLTSRALDTSVEDGVGEQQPRMR